VIIKKLPRTVVLLAAGWVVAGCANAGPAEVTTTDGRQPLARSLTALRAGNYTFIRTDGSTVQGSVHLPEASLITQEAGPSVLRTGSACYLRYRIHGEQHDRYADLYDKRPAGLTAKDAAEMRRATKILAVLDGEQWVRADEKRLAAAAAAEDQSGIEYLPAAPTTDRADVTGATALVDAVVSAELSGTTVTGTLDATKVDPGLRLFTNDPYYFHGPKAKAMPYRATLDDQGRLTQITVQVPGQLQAPASQAPADVPSDSPTEAPGQPLAITISQYGQTSTPQAPKDATDLDPAAYDLLTNDTD
jgi:hypothetical protein